MKVKSQREAVYQAIVNAYSEAGIHFEDGMDVSGQVQGEFRAGVQAILCEGFRGGTIEFEATPSNKEKLANPSKLSAYVSGLISNWVRKDTRLNGGDKYVAKNPGSRTGQSDEQMKTLRALKKQFAGTDKEALVDAQIEKRKAEIAAAKTKTVALTPEQIDALPADVRESLGL